MDTNIENQDMRSSDICNTSSWANRSEGSLPMSSRNGQQSVLSLDLSAARYFVVKREEGTFTSVSPFFIDKAIRSSVGVVKEVKKLRSGDLFVQVENSDQALKFMKCKHFGDIAVQVSAHGSLNVCKGVISDRDLLNCSENEILLGLKEQHVCGVRRITIKRGEEMLPTKHLILTFDSPLLPSHVKAGYLRCPVRPYVPNPLRCFQCQRFGHSKAACRGSQTCARCSNAGHDSENCQDALKCVNCKGEHAAFSRDCPMWTTEKEIQVVKTTQKLSYPDARKMVESRVPRTGLSYAAALKVFKTTSTQTDTLPLANTNSCKSGSISVKSPGQCSSQNPQYANNEQKKKSVSNVQHSTTAEVTSIKKDSKKQKLQNQLQKPSITVENRPVTEDTQDRPVSPNTSKPDTEICAPVQNFPLCSAEFMNKNPTKKAKRSYSQKVLKGRETETPIVKPRIPPYLRKNRFNLLAYLEDTDEALDLFASDLEEDRDNAKPTKVKQKVSSDGAHCTGSTNSRHPS